MSVIASTISPAAADPLNKPKSQHPAKRWAERDTTAGEAEEGQQWEDDRPASQTV